MANPLGPSTLQSLPDELFDLILRGLSYTDLCNLTLGSRWTYTRTVPAIWKDLKLVDRESRRRVRYVNADIHKSQGTIQFDYEDVLDQHDETPILKKLFVLATNPYVAQSVQTIVLRCHLPTPELFDELPNLRHDDDISFDLDASLHSTTYTTLVLQAVSNMVNVHTLKIIMGHCGLASALTWGFFGPHRSAKVPIRKLWLESCSIRPLRYARMWSPLDFREVQSLRLRRLWFNAHWTDLPYLDQRVDPGSPQMAYSYARGSIDTQLRLLRTAAANHYTAQVVGSEKEAWRPHVDKLNQLSFVEIVQNSRVPCLSFVRWVSSLNCDADRPRQDFDAAERHLEAAYRMQSLDSVLRLLSNQSPSVCTLHGVRETTLSSTGLSVALDPAYVTHSFENIGCQPSLLVDMSSLTSLTLDWVIFVQGWDRFVATDGSVRNLTEADRDSVIEGRAPESLKMQEPPIRHALVVLERLSRQRFSNLRAFQLRNCVQTFTRLDPDVRLFFHPLSRENYGIDFLGFLEAHPKLQCLAWPMDRFFPGSVPLPLDIAERAQRVIGNLGRTLVDLRVDAMLSGAGEPLTDEAVSAEEIDDRTSRRRFITEVAPHMRSLTSVKMEGGIPRDEKRETINALKHCPLEKLVFIGASFPIVNTWGESGELIMDADDGMTRLIPVLQDEDEGMLRAAMSWRPSDFSSADNHADYLVRPFSAQWGRDREPMLYTISHFATTIRELKFCGYLGAPFLQRPTPPTEPALCHLRHFHELSELVISFWVATFFDHDHRDQEIIQYWLDMRSSQSTALAVVPPPIPPNATPEVNPTHEPAGEALEESLNPIRWLYDNFHPISLAEKVKNFLGPCLSPTAKARPGGLRVRASFCMGTDVQDIFDFDVRIGVNVATGADVVLERVGPREDSWESGRSAEKLAARRWF